MSKKLIDTNPYLQDPKLRQFLIKRSVRTSCGVEGIISTNSLKFKIHKRKPKRIYILAS